MPAQPNYTRCLLSAVSGFCFTMFVICAIKTWQQYGAQEWASLDYKWLGLDLWSRAWEIKEALAGAGLTLILALIGERFASNSFVGLRLVRWGNRLASRAWTVAVLAFLALGLPRMAASLTQPDAPQQAPNVLYVMVDTWRADHVGWLGYERDVTPQLDKLVEKGVIFEHAISSSGWTKPSVGTQLTGLMPSTHQAVSQPMTGIDVHGVDLPPDRLTWIEVLRAQGWDTAMWSNNPNILPTHGFDQGAGYFVDYINHPEKRNPTDDDAGFDRGRAERMLPDVREWIDNSWDRSRPFAAYLHILDPHYPYVAPAPFKGKFDKTGLDFQLDGIICGDYMEGEADPADVTPEMLERINAIYDEEIAYVDHYLAPFLIKIQAEFPNTVVVLVSDHGEEFMEHGWFGHGQSIYSELVNVPLVIWGPSLTPQRVPWQVRLMDLYPTVLDLAGVSPPDEPSVPYQGENLVDMEEAHRIAPMESGGDERPPWHWRGLSDGEWKVIERLEVNPNDHETWLKREGGIPVLNQEAEEIDMNYMEIYQISQDSIEQNNLIKPELQRARSLLQLMQENGWYHRADYVNAFGTSSTMGASEEDMERLGYLTRDTKPTKPPEKPKRQN
ncbi:MAG: sulfatase [Planctomycetes bacterium]|nr:sulfatase [Planctomycetota bacterium]